MPAPAFRLKRRKNHLKKQETGQYLPSGRKFSSPPGFFGLKCTASGDFGKIFPIIFSFLAPEPYLCLPELKRDYKFRIHG
jgi:hypothetical protein